MKYKGITTTKLKNGDIAIMVRFKYEGKIYPIKNFTKLFGSRTEREAFNKLQEVKLSLSKGIDPFKRTGSSINELYDIHSKSANWGTVTRTQYDRFYRLYIRKPIGHKKIQKVTYDDLYKILQTLQKYSVSQQNKLKIILSPIFKSAIRKKLIIDNPLDYIENKVSAIKQPIDERVINDDLFIAKELYRCIPLYKTQNEAKKDEIHAFFMLLLMTAHRYGELIQLTKDDVYNDMIMSPAEITKTKVPYRFPLPVECKKHVASVRNGLLFPNVNHGSVLQMFRRIVKTTNIKLLKGKYLTPHDSRRLFMSILIRDGADVLLTDMCLDHSPKGVIKHYIKFDYDHKVKFFEKYWGILRES